MERSRHFQIEYLNILNEAELIKRIRNRDEKAFRELVDHDKDLVGSIVFRMIRYGGDREDLCQDVFVKIFENIGGFRMQSKLSTWIARITYNTCINYLEKKRPDLPGEEILELNSLADNHTFSNAETTVEKSSMKDIINTEVMKLPLKYRVVITMYHYSQMSYEEISSATGLAEGTVKSHIFRGRKYLKERIIKQYQREDL